MISCLFWFVFFMIDLFFYFVFRPSMFHTIAVFFSYLLWYFILYSFFLSLYILTSYLLFLTCFFPYGFFLCFYLSYYLSIFLTIYASIHLSIYLSNYLTINLCIFCCHSFSVNSPTKFISSPPSASFHLPSLSNFIHFPFLHLLRYSGSHRIPQCVKSIQRGIQKRSG